MFSHVVVGVDFSPGGEVVIRSLEALSRLGTRRVTLVHALHVRHPLNEPEPYAEGYRAHLEQLRGRVADRGFEAAAALVLGDPAVEVPRHASEGAADLILVGSRGQSRLHEAFIGSTAWGILRHAEVPVLVQRISSGNLEGADSEGGGPPGAAGFPVETPVAFQRVLFATDGSGSAETAFAHVRDLAAHGSIATFSLLHVRSQIAEARSGRSTEQEVLEKLRALAEALEEAGAAEVEYAAPSGAPFVEIVRTADAIPGTLIVMGTHGRGRLGEAFLGSVSLEVVRTSRSPVLLIQPR